MWIPRKETKMPQDFKEALQENIRKIRIPKKGAAFLYQ
jgi:hypothetical protein